MVNNDPPSFKIKENIVDPTPKSTIWAWIRTNDFPDPPTDPASFSDINGISVWTSGTFKAANTEHYQNHKVNYIKKPGIITRIDVPRTNISDQGPNPKNKD